MEIFLSLFFIFYIIFFEVFDKIYWKYFPPKMFKIEKRKYNFNRENVERMDKIKILKFYLNHYF
jgi:hypothetical protein